MGSVKRFVAFDLGASSGKALVGEYDGNKLTSHELYRFVNHPVRVHDGLYWDVLALYREIKTGLAEYVKTHGPALEGIAIDSWGVDFGLFDRAGELIGNPRHYRDARTRGMLEEINSVVGGYSVYSATGVNLEPISTLCQLYSLVKSGARQLDAAERLLMMPSIFAYFLTGENCDEHSNVSASGIWDFRDDAPAAGFLSTLGIPVGLIPPVVQPGSTIGPLLPCVREETGLGEVPVFACATHDSASAVIGVPASHETNWAYLSCGTWSVLGLEGGQPATSLEAYEAGITSAATAGGKYMTRCNITGLWILQQCRDEWERSGNCLSWDDMVRAAEAAVPFAAFIDPDSAVFANPPDMLQALLSYLESTGQPAPADTGGMIRIVLESLAMKYRNVLDRLERVTGRKPDILHLVGGGARNALLCRLTASATRLPVVAGPVEATALGNIVLQMIGAGVVGSVSEGRDLLRASSDLVEYPPTGAGGWDDAYGRYCGLHHQQ